MGRAEREELLEHLVNLRDAGVNLFFERIPRNEKRRHSKVGRISVGIWAPGKVIIAPEKARSGVYLFCDYFENLVNVPYNGPRFTSMGSRGLKTTCVALSNNVKYLICRRHPSQVPYLGEYQREALKKSEEFNFAELEI